MTLKDIQNRLMYLKDTGVVRNHGIGFRIRESDIIYLYEDKKKLL